MALKLEHVLVVLAFVACGEGEHATLGDGCDEDSACATGLRCITEEVDHTYPGGICTQSCVDHVDCPSTAACVGEQDGICLVRCAADDDCRPDYFCTSKANQSGQGESAVCLGND